MNIIDYRVICTSSVARFNEWTAEAAKAGWQPYGSMIVGDGTPAEQVLYQAFVKYDVAKNEGIPNTRPIKV